jgi:hypothetical protein
MSDFHTKDIVPAAFALNLADKTLSEAEMIAFLAEHVGYLLEHKLDFLLSLMYRLDIDEDKINYAFLPHNAEPTNVALARLIFDRQKQRLHTKRIYKPIKIEGWDDF